ncbi:MAG TPA: hypothetical protein VJN18_21400 [Polyangiaceae bacterium]|nr:hypothetical protein [Polyangiaceae bacterium]
MTDPGSPEFPAPKDDDDDDVAWALSTASVQWKRGTPADAVVWLRRAIDSAVAVAATWRAAELTRQTDALEAYLQRVPAAPEQTIIEVEEDFDGTDMIDAEAMSLPPDDDLSEVAREKLPYELSGDSTDETTDITPDEQAVAEPEEVEEIDDGEVTAEEDDPDSIDELLGADPGFALPRFPSEAPNQFPSEAPTAELPGIEDMLELEPEPQSKSQAEPEPEPDAEPDTVSEPEPHYDAEGEDDPSPTPIRQSVADAEPSAQPAPEPPLEPGPPPEPELSEPLVAGVSLAEIKGFEDFPPETQIAMAKAARIDHLGIEEEVSGFGLALVLRGGVNVMPAIADVACGTVVARDLIYGRGTLTEGVALRLVAMAPDTEVAVWDFEAIEPPLADCPWVQEELQAVADRYQALAGVSMGPMGDRLDDSLRGMVLSRCQLVRLLPGELLVEKGKPIGGLYIVGAGRIELDTDTASPGPEGQLGPGEFLFAMQVLAAGVAPTAARAGSTGALLMMADRHAAHELMVSVPPLLELLAG